MIHALVQGDLTKEPQQRTTQGGQPFAFTSMRVAAGDEAVFVSLSIFGTASVEKLMSLKKGDAVGATGVLKQTIYAGRDGEERKGWALTASEVITVYEAAKRRKAAPASVDDGERSREPAFADDEFPPRGRG